MEQFYFKINLNKFGELRLQQEIERRVFLTFLLIFIIGSIVMFGFVVYLQKDLQQKLDNREQLLLSINQQIESYKISGDFLSSNDLDRLAKVFNERVFWAKKLVALANQTEKRIAITDFTFKRGILSLYGITKIDKDEKEFDLIDDFIVSLKNNQQISSDFPDIKFVKSSRDREKDTDIIRFQIDAVGKDYSSKKRR
ncbi:MAG: hypothetical protein JXR56_07060 [Candidatus Cloacimonetes bacterium]|nr:hypothetical protein [Candidatus Cloacimonadota bacterium]